MLNIPKTIKSYSQYAQLKYYKLQEINMKFYHLFRSISEDFWLEVPKIAKNGTLVFLLMFVKTDTLSINITIQSLRYYVELLLFEDKSEI